MTTPLAAVKHDILVKFVDSYKSTIEAAPGAGMVSWTGPQPATPHRRGGIAAVKRWFERTDMTIDQFAEMVGVSRMTVHRWFARKSYPNERHIRIIQQISGVSLRPRRRR